MAGIAPILSIYQRHQRAPNDCRSIKPVLFKALYASWEVTNALGIDKGPRANGYSALLPVPADLPVFLQIALKSLLTQDQKHLAEILMIRDIPSDDFRVASKKLMERISLRDRGRGIMREEIRPFDERFAMDVRTTRAKR